MNTVHWTAYADIWRGRHSVRFIHTYIFWDPMRYTARCTLHTQNTKSRANSIKCLKRTMNSSNHSINERGDCCSIPITNEKQLQYLPSIMALSNIKTKTTIQLCTAPMNLPRQWFHFIIRFVVTYQWWPDILHCSRFFIECCFFKAFYTNLDKMNRKL